MNVPSCQFDSLEYAVRTHVERSESATVNRTAAFGPTGDGDGLSHTDTSGIDGYQHQCFRAGATAEHAIAGAG